MRNATRFTFNIGYIILAVMIGVIVTGIFMKYINQSNIMELINSLLIFVAASFGINQTRNTIENTTSIKAGNPVPSTSVSTVVTTPDTTVLVKQ